MYYRKNGQIVDDPKGSQAHHHMKPHTVEHFTVTDSNGGNGGCKFPLWLLILIIVLVVVAAIFLIYGLTRKNSKGKQNFGFRFY